jgi:4-amino-4-deoxychorismate lyase
MYRFIETIRVEQGRPQHLKYHQERVNRTVAHFWGGDATPISLAEVIRVPQEKMTVILKCRVTYGEQIEKVDFEQYLPHPAASLRVVHDNDIDYNFKYADRSRLNELLNQRKNCDDVLIVKSGLVADTSYCNMLFYDGKNWVTPATPLLKGACRARLLENGIITEEIITLADLGKFQKFMLINAMLEFDVNRSAGIEGIKM